MRTTNGSLSENSDPAQTQNLGVKAAPAPNIRDRSAKQRALPIDKPARPFVSKCVDVNAGGPLETLIYLCLAARCRAFVDGDTAQCRIGRERLRADTKMGVTAFESHLAVLLATGLVSVKRTGRTNIYTVRTVAAMLRASNSTTDPEAEPESWKAAGVSRATWYRDRARTDPKKRPGRPRIYASDAERLRAWRETKPETDTPRGGVSDTPRGGVSTEEGSEEVRTSSSVRPVRTQPTRDTAAARETCESCGRSWPAKFGTVCHACGDRPQKRSTTPAAVPSCCYGRVRNCPQCHAYDRGHEDRCEHCPWTRAAWEARVTE